MYMHLYTLSILLTTDLEVCDLLPVQQSYEVGQWHRLTLPRMLMFCLSLSLQHIPAC